MLAACSGGADSVALVLALAELARAGRLSVVVAHVHHGLRGAEADSDRDRVAGLAEALDLPFTCLVADARAAAATRRRGMEEAARHVRRAALEEARRAAGAGWIALAHTADDQAETILMRLLRGAGARGLAGMAERSGVLVRPFLAVRRDELRAHLHAAGVPWASDASNWTPRNARSLVREVLARLETSLDERVVERLCQSARHLGEDDACLTEQAAALLAERCPAPRGASFRVRDANAIGDAPPAIGRRAVRLLLEGAHPDGSPATADALARALRLFQRGSRPSSVRVAGLTLHRDGPDVVSGVTRVSVPAAPTPLPEGASVRWAHGRIEAQRGAPETSPARGSRVVVDIATLPGGLAVRARTPGDRLGAASGRSVTRILQRGGVPLGRRAQHPVVCLAGDPATIVWIAGFHADPTYLATPNSTDALELRWEPAALDTGAPE